MDYLPITTSYIVKKKLVIALLDARTIQNIIGVCNRLVLFCFINRRPKVFVYYSGHCKNTKSRQSISDCQ